MLPPLRSSARCALLASVFLVGCSALSDVDAEFTGGLPGEAAGGNTGPGGRGPGGGGLGGRGGNGSGAGTAGNAATTKGGASGTGNGGAAAAGAGGVASGAAGSSGGAIAGAAGRAGQAGTNAGSSGNAGATGLAGKAGSGGVGGLGGASGQAGGAGAGGKSGQAGAAGAGGKGGQAGAAGAGGKSGSAGGGGTAGVGGAGAGGGTSGQSGSAGSSGSAGKAGAGGSGGAGGAAGTGGGGQAGSGGSCPGTGSDPDCDGFTGTRDNCSLVANPDQADQDGDKIGDLCDDTPGGADATTQFGSCGALAGTAAIELLAVPTFSCAGASFSVSYRAGGNIPCGSTIQFRAYRKVGGSMSAFPGLATTTALTGDVNLLGAAALAPGVWFLEASVAGIASKRSRVVIGGTSLSVDAPTAAALQAGPVEIAFDATPNDPAIVYTLDVDGVKSMVASPTQVTFAGLGQRQLRLAAETPDGCTTTRDFQIEVLSCNPSLPSSTVVSPAPPAASNVLVCDGASHTTANGIATLYARPNAALVLGNGINRVWLSPGATVVPGGGPLTLIYTGAKPALAGLVTYVACPSIAFDESAVAAPGCPLP